MLEFYYPYCFRFSLDGKPGQLKTSLTLTAVERSKRSKICHGRLIFTKKLGLHNNCKPSVFKFLIEN